MTQLQNKLQQTQTLLDFYQSKPNPSIYQTQINSLLQTKKLIQLSIKYNL